MGLLVAAATLQLAQLQVARLQLVAIIFILPIQDLQLKITPLELVHLARKQLHICKEFLELL